MEFLGSLRIGLAQLTEPAGLGELFAIALGPAVLGILLFAFGRVGERAGAIKPGIKWIAMAPVIIGIIMGWEYFKTVTGPEGETFKLTFMIEKKAWLYQAAFILPLLVGIALPLWGFFAARRDAMASDEEWVDEAEADAGDEEEYEEEYEEEEYEEEYEEGEEHDEEDEEPRR